MKALTNADLVRIFDVTPMTIYNWRMADPEHARKSPLPSTVKGREVTFNAIRIKAWATKNDVPMKLDPVDIAEGGSGIIRKKPGPKPHEHLPVYVRGAAFRKMAARDVAAIADKKSRKAVKTTRKSALRA